MRLYDDPPELDTNDPEFRKRPICRHIGGDPDCDCYPEEDEEDE